MYFKLLLFITCLVYCDSLDEGEPCRNQNLFGICTRIFDCTSALEGLRRGQTPKTCGFIGPEPIVCCTGRLNHTQKPTATTTQRPHQPPAFPSTYMPEEADYILSEEKGEDSCKPIPPNMTAARTGQKALDKCIEYQEKYVYPCEKSAALTGELVRSNKCHHNADQLIIGGTDTTAHEFPHMAMVGFGDSLMEAQFLCGGTVISERFILTAGHCVANKDREAAKYALIGINSRSSVRRSNIYRIKSVIKHPDHRPPNKYNDIALLELFKPIKLSDEIVPACLPVDDSDIGERALATGWGLTAYEGSVSDTMQKVVLQKFSDRECSQAFNPQRLLRLGFDVNTQMCYGDKSESKDTCQGDSGGPIQVKSKKIHCMYVVIGVTSFGRGCGFVGQPAVYTRVSHFVPWIESIVWP